MIETDRLILRRPTAADAPVATAFWQSPRSMHVGGDVIRPTAWRHFAAMLGHWEIRGYGLWAVVRRDTNQTIGLVGPWYPDGWPETEIGWLLFDGAEGHGFAAEAARAAMDHARTELGWTDIVHYIAPANDRSIALAERLGAVRDDTAQVPNPEKPTLVYRQVAA